MVRFGAKKVETSPPFLFYNTRFQLFIRLQLGRSSQFPQREASIYSRKVNTANLLRINSLHITLTQIPFPLTIKVYLDSILPYICRTIA